MTEVTFSFDLITEPCIPVLDAAGRPLTLGIREMLLQAHELRELNHASPVVAASLVRFLVALLTDIHPLPNPSSWGAIWKRRSFDANAITAYFEKYGERFDLFHRQYPFYQCAALEDDNPVNLNLLASELATGNNPTLFDHSLDTVERDYSPMEAFHLLLATQNFALAGLLRRTTRLKGAPETIYWQSAYGGALIPGAMIWLTGDNLFETLALNLAPLERLDDEDESNIDDSEQDRPAWRLDRPELLRDRMTGKSKTATSPLGTRDRLTLQSRLMRLLPVQVESGVVVRRAAFNHGRSLDAAQHSFDPMLAYRPSKKEGYLVTRLSPERAAWRDVHSLMGLNTKSKDGKFERVTPRSLSLLHDALDRKLPDLDGTRLLRLNVAGIANDQAKILLWRHDRLDAPAAVLCDPAMAERVGVLLQEAEEVAGALRGATRRLCEHFLAPLSVDPAGAPVEGAMRADPDRVTALADCIDPRPAYWARMESAFHHLLLRLGTDADAASEEWKDQVQREAARAFDEAKRRLGDRPAILKAAALVRSFFLVPSRRERSEDGKRKRSATGAPASR